MTAAARVRARLTTAAHILDGTLDRHASAWAALFVALTFAGAVVVDLRARMWIDELLTLHVAQLGGLGGAIEAALKGADGIPPLYSTLASALLPVVGHEALAVRLPSTLGFCVMVLCLVSWCRRQGLSGVFAWIAPLLTATATLYYASDGRPYGLVLGAASGALLAWDQAISGRGRWFALPLLAISLSLAVAGHYYAVFFVAALGLGELARWYTVKRVDLAMLVAFGVPVLVLTAHYPLLAPAAQFQTFFWSPAAWDQLPAFYVSYLLPSFGRIAILAMVALAVMPREERAAANGPEWNVPSHVWVALAAIALSPVVAVVVSVYVTRAFVDRYLLWATIGFALLLAMLFRRIVNGHVFAGTAATVVLAFLFTGGLLRNAIAEPRLFRGESALQALEQVPPGQEPLVVTDLHVFEELSYYARPQVRARLVYLLDREIEMNRLGSDSGSLLMEGLDRIVPLRMTSFDELVSRRQEVIVVADRTEPALWLLMAAGHRVEPIEGGGTTLHRVRIQR